MNEKQLRNIIREQIKKQLVTEDASAVALGKLLGLELGNPNGMLQTAINDYWETGWGRGKDYMSWTDAEELTTELVTVDVPTESFEAAMSQLARSMPNAAMEELEQELINAVAELVSTDPQS